MWDKINKEEFAPEQTPQKTPNPNHMFWCLTRNGSFTPSFLLIFGSELGGKPGHKTRYFSV
jgi:hypothetical protein